MNIIWTRCSRILISPEFWGPSLVYLDPLGFRPILISRDARACGPQFGRPQFGGAHNQCHKQIRSQQQSDQKLDCWKHLGSRLVSRHVHVLYLRASWLHWNSWGWVHPPSARGRRSCHYCCRSHLFAWSPMGNCWRYYHDSFHSCGGRNWSKNGYARVSSFEESKITVGCSATTVGQLGLTDSELMFVFAGRDGF